MSIEIIQALFVITASAVAWLFLTTVGIVSWLWSRKLDSYDKGFVRYVTVLLWVPGTIAAFCVTCQEIYGILPLLVHR